MKTSTLCFLVRGDEILLAMKKRGFGVGKWNGAGGKLNDNESIEHAAIRELEEEIGVTASESDLKPMGLLRFRSANEKFDWDCSLFFVEIWEGEPRESEEMRPQWFAKDKLPFADMWPDDKDWFPYVLAGKKILGDFEFDPEGRNILNFTIKEI